MEPTNRRLFTQEFKDEAVKLVIERGYSQLSAATSLGVNESNLRRWIKEYKTGKKESHQKKSTVVVHENPEIQELLKKINRLEMEKEILKKAAAFFAKESTKGMFL